MTKMLNGIRRTWPFRGACVSDLLGFFYPDATKPHGVHYYSDAVFVADFERRHPEIDCSDVFAHFESARGDEYGYFFAPVVESPNLILVIEPVAALIVRESLDICPPTSELERERRMEAVRMLEKGR